jgi:two-component system chemotaxis response regulator CheB
LGWRHKALYLADLAQDEASCVVHGMPGEAIRLGAASFALPPEMIAAALTRLVNHS